MKAFLISFAIVYAIIISVYYYFIGEPNWVILFLFASFSLGMASQIKKEFDEEDEHA